MRDVHYGTTPATRRRGSSSTRPWITIAGIMLVCACAALVLLDLLSGLNPVTDALSIFAFHSETGWLLQLGAGCLALGALVTFGALGAGGLYTLGSVGVLLVGWAGGLMLTTLFRASMSFHPAPIEGVVHRWAAALAFVSLPGAGFALIARLRSVPELARVRAVLLRVCLLTSASLVVFGVFYLLPESLTWLPVGLSQRLTLIADVVLLATMLCVAARAERRRAPPQVEDTS